MKLPALIATVIVAVTGTALWIAAASPQDDARASGKGKQEESSIKVGELQKERLATLRELAEVMRDLYQKARVDADRAYDAQQLLLRAEVELAENDSDRVKLYEKFVGVMKEYEAMAATKKEAGRGTHTDILRAKAIRLEAEIDLEQMMAKATK